MKGTGTSTTGTRGPVSFANAVVYRSWVLAMRARTRFFNVFRLVMTALSSRAK